jgi:hypothetical protein
MSSCPTHRSVSFALVCLLLGATGLGCSSGGTKKPSSDSGGEGGDGDTGGSSPGGSGGTVNGGSGGSRAGGSGGSANSGGSAGSGDTGGASGSSDDAGVGTGGASGDDAATGAGDDGSAGGTGGGPAGDGGLPVCAYKDDKSFCDCMGGWDCGGITTKDDKGIYRTVYCGQCSNTQYCQPSAAAGTGVGKCGGSNPLIYAWQRQKIDMLVAMGENDNTKVNYDYAENIKDMRGYTIGKVGFTTGTGDFIIVARCYNDLKPANVLAKYFGHENAMGVPTDGLAYYKYQFLTKMMNQGDTKLIDSLAAGSSFVKDCATAAKDAEYRQCQDSLADADYMSAALAHADERGLKGALTIGFLYDTELNFGEDDDINPPTPGTRSILALADKDYGAGLPTDFTGKPWEESRWLGYVIKERAIVMAANSTWKDAVDQDATWEAARRLHTAKTNTPESATDLSMNYDITSAYKAGFKTPGPCWTGLASTIDSQGTSFTVTLDKAASPTDQTKWVAKAIAGGPTKACPANPTP